NPPSVIACALDPGVDATAAARPELLHGSSPSTLDARVSAIYRPSARSHRTVDNSLITGRIEYSTFRNLPLDECIVNTPPESREVIKREARKRKTQASDRKALKVKNNHLLKQRSI